MKRWFTAVSYTHLDVYKRQALGRAESDPVNYAMRNALLDLSQFEGFDEVVGWFEPGTMEAYAYEGGYYALPETQAVSYTHLLSLARLWQTGSGDAPEQDAAGNDIRPPVAEVRDWQAVSYTHLDVYKRQCMSR